MLDIKGNIILPSGTYVLDRTSVEHDQQQRQPAPVIQLHVHPDQQHGGTDIGNVSLQGGKLDITAPDYRHLQGARDLPGRRASAVPGQLQPDQRQFELDPPGRDLLSRTSS